jgi:dephospho-CoA kinase
MIVVGLTGGIGSGKSSVSEIFEGLGVKVVDADVASRQPVKKGQPTLKKIAEKFGSNILTSEGELDRRKLREIIFKESSAKDWLENLLHPLIHQILIDDLATASSKYAILVSPLLFETNQKDLCLKTIVVDTSEDNQIDRTTKRDNVEASQIKSIIDSQIDRKTRNELADIIISNDGSLQELEEKVKKIHQDLEREILK